MEPETENMERTTAADEDSKSPANSQTQPLSHFAFQAAFATAIHPMTVAKVLIQVIIQINI